jgi:hypothetical protein
VSFWIFFFCFLLIGEKKKNVPSHFFPLHDPERSAVGGETPVLPSDELAKQVAAQLPEFYARLKAHGVIYTRVLDCARAGGAEDGLQRSWQAAMLPPGGLPEGTRCCAFFSNLFARYFLFLFVTDLDLQG